MKKYLLTLGLALLGAIALLGQAPMAIMATDGSGGAYGGGVASGCKYCPHCGCQLVPMCQIDCVTKKLTTYKHTCSRQYICVPGVTRLLDKCGNQDCRCRIHEVHRLMKYPSVKEEPVKKCSVRWTCPNCGSEYGS